MARIELIEQTLRHTPHEGFCETSIPEFRLYRQHTPTFKPMPAIYEPSICVITQGAKHLRLGERKITYDPWNYLVSAFTLPVDAEIHSASPDEPFLGLVIRFDPVQVGKLLAEIDDLIDWPSEEPFQAMSACPISPSLARVLGRLMNCLDDAMDRKVLTEGLLREVLYEVLRGPRGHILREQTLRGASSQIARAIAFLEQSYDQPVDVETIARHAAMSPSTLHEHFKRLTSLSPMQYVQRLRLHRARALLLGGQTVAEAGFAVGYNSPSQFSREFRRLFGVPPSRARAV